jgi:phage N-6-adenine-methyltransferase
MPTSRKGERLNTDVMFSSATDLWSTPQEYFDSVSKEFQFTLDVCALPENTKCQKFFSPEDDGLLQQWEGVCWMNPPYGRVIGKWVQKAYKSAKAGAVVVGLLPARTDTKWFHDYIYGKAEIRFIRGRLKFGGCANSAPFPNMLVIWKN